MISLNQVFNNDKIQVDNLRDIAILEKSRLDAENAARAVISQGTGGFFIFLTALIAFLNYLQTRRNVTLSEEKQITERFAKAVEMLGHTDIHVFSLFMVTFGLSTGMLVIKLH